MTATRKTLAIVLRRSDFRESSRIVGLMTRDFGRLAFLAKGAHRPRSPFLGAIDLLHVGEARVSVRAGRGLQSLYAFRVTEGNAPFRHDPLRRALAYRLVEGIRLAMPEGRVDAQAFDLLHGGLRLLRAAPRARLRAVHVALALRLLDGQGLLPPLDRCPLSDAPLPERGRVGFAPEAGGFVALDRGGRPVDAALATLARRLLATPGRALPGLALPAGPLAELERLVDDLWRWRLEEEPRVALPPALFAEAELAEGGAPPRIRT
ncbi:MAG: DNA repair protein RecO [Planctomycetota bacterium]